MVTEQASSVSTEPASLANWTSWLAGLAGLWILISSFVLIGTITSGNPMYGSVIAGGIAAVLAAYAGDAME